MTAHQDDDTPSGGAGLAMLACVWLVVTVALLVMCATSWWGL